MIELQIYYFYVKEWPDAISALSEVTFEKVYTGDDNLHYSRELKARWDTSEDFMVVEQDIQIHEDVIASFNECSNIWCCFLYDFLPTGDHVGPLGCTRFRGEKTVKSEEIGKRPVKGLGPVQIPESLNVLPSCEWYQLDIAVYAAMTFNGYNPCIHTPPVRHLRPAIKGN